MKFSIVTGEKNLYILHGQVFVIFRDGCSVFILNTKSKTQNKLCLNQRSRLMGKPTICIGENKDADQLRGYRAFLFATRIVQFLFYLNPKFQASSSFLCLYRPVCVGPVRKPHCWFSHEAAQRLILAKMHPFGRSDYKLPCMPFLLQ